MTGYRRLRGFSVQLVPFLLPSLAIGLIEMAVAFGWVSRSQYVAPHVLIPFLWSKELFTDLGWTCYRLVAGVCLGAIAGMLCGFTLSQNRIADRLASSTLGALSAIPIIIWLPFVSSRTGLGDLTKIVFVAIGTFFLIQTHCYHSAKEEDKMYTELTQVYESTLWQRLGYVVIPASWGELLTAIRLSFGLGWVVVAYAEFSIQDSNRHFGIGQFILQNKNDGKIEEMFAGMVVLACTGTAIDSILRLIEKRLRSWADDSMHNSP